MKHPSVTARFYLQFFLKSKLCSRSEKNQRLKSTACVSKAKQDDVNYVCQLNAMNINFIDVTILQHLFFLQSRKKENNPKSVFIFFYFRAFSRHYRTQF
jgi:hypothetical protein